MSKAGGPEILTFGHNLGIQPTEYRAVAAQVAVMNGFTEITLASEEVVGRFDLVRSRNTGGVVQISWRIEADPDAGTPLTPDMFEGGAFPSGTALVFQAGVTMLPIAVVFAAGAVAQNDLFGRVVIFNPVNAELDPYHQSFGFKVNRTEVVAGDAIMALDVQFSELVPAVDMATLYNFTVRRSGDMTQTVSIAWKIEGTGTNPLTAALFAGSVFPSGTATFAPNETEKLAAFSIKAQERPTVELAGQVVLYSPPGGVRIDPLAGSAPLRMPKQFIQTGGLIPGYKPYSDPSLKKPDGSAKTRVLCNGAGALNTAKTFVANGTYKPETHVIVLTGDAKGYDWSGWQGTDANPLVIMADAPNGRANFTGRPDIGEGKITPTSRNLWFYQLKMSTPLVQFTSGTQGVTKNCMAQSGYRIFITRCLIDGQQGIRCDTAYKAWHGFNTFTGKCADYSGDHNEAQHYCQYGGDAYADPTKRSREVWAYRNFMTQSGNFGGTEHHVFYFGNGVPKPGDMTSPYPITHDDCWIVENFICTWRKRAVYCKSATNILRNHIVSPGSWDSRTPSLANGRVYQQIGFRGVNPQDGWARGNRMRGHGYLILEGHNHKIEDNLLEGPTVYLAAHCIQSDGKPLIGANGARISKLKGVRKVVLGVVRDDSGYTYYSPDPLTDVIMALTDAAGDVSWYDMSDATVERQISVVSGHPSATNPAPRHMTPSGISISFNAGEPDTQWLCPEWSEADCGANGSGGWTWGEEPAEPDAYDLVAANYTQHGPSSGVTVTWLADGVRINSGSNTGAKCCRLWCKTAAPSGDAEFRFIARQIDTYGNADTDSEGVFALFGPRYRGLGNATIPTDPNAWPTTLYRGISGQPDAGDVIYRNNGRGYRFSFANHNSDASISQMIRDRTYEGPGDTQIQASSPSPMNSGFWDMAPSTDYLFVGRRVSDRITWTKTNLSTNATKTAIFDSNTIGSGASGLGIGGFMFFGAHRGRTIEFRKDGTNPIAKAL